MTPPNPMIESVIENGIPNLRIALEKMLAGSGAHIFTLAGGTDTQTGAQSKIVCIVCQQPVGIIIESILSGMAQAEQFVLEQQRIASEFGKVTQ